jgi:hypothetical protein
MDTSFIFNFISEIAYLLIVLAIVFTYTLARGRQAVINLIFGLYLALLISLEFPFYDQIFGSFEAQMLSIAKLGLFATFTIITTILATRVMPDAFREGKFESFGKKFLLAISATVLIMIFSFHVLPVTDFLTPGTPIQSLFAPEQYFFWWLLLPIILLFVV